MATALGVLGLCGLAYFTGHMHGSSHSAAALPQQARSTDAHPTPQPRRSTSLHSSETEPQSPAAKATPSFPNPAPPPQPLHTSETIRATADALPDLLAAWDARVAEDLFGDIDLDTLEKKLAWMHEQVGRCDAGTPMTSGNASQGRFSYVCERGVVEAGFSMSDPDASNIANMRAGVRDVDPPPEVSDAAADVVDLIEAWDDDAFEERFSDSFRDKLGASMPDFTEELRDELGSCSVGPVDLASHSGALFVLDCDTGRRTMVVALDEQHRIRALRVVPLRRDPGQAD